LPCRDPVRHPFRRLLLEEHLASDPVGVTLHRERPVAEMGDERRPDGTVVLEQVALRDPVASIENAVGAREFDRALFRHHAGTFWLRIAQVMEERTVKLSSPDRVLY